VSDDGGFSWGLRPRKTDDTAAADAVVSDDAADASLVVAGPAPMPPADAPTEAMSAIDVPTQAIEAHELATQALQAVDLPGHSDDAADVPTEVIAAHDLPTEAIEAHDLPTQAIEEPDLPAAPPPLPTEPLSWRDLSEIAPAAELHEQQFAAESTSAIDSLFAENQFQPYEEVGVLQSMTAADVGAVGGPSERAQRASLTSTQKIVIIVGAIVVAILALVALFLIGMRSGTATAKAAAASAHTSAPHSAKPSPAATTSTGALAPGVHPWTALQGGECIQPFTSAWAVSFKTVDCATPHAAQLLLKGALPETADATYPSAAALQTEIMPLCTASKALNYAAAGAITDAQITVTYPPTKSDWAKGDRGFACYISRTSGGPISGSLVAPAS
jgi:hypothetical protein